MMQVKIFEIRDRATFFPAIAIQLKLEELDHDQAPQEMYLLRRAGYGGDDIRAGTFVLLTHAQGGGAMHYDPYGWAGSRTYQVAHQYITQHFDNLPGGAVIDVQYILGEISAPHPSERFNDIVKEIEAKDG